MDNFSTLQSMPAEDKFKLGKKWFWMGIAISFFSAIAGLLYGIVLALEKNYQKEGLIIISVAIIWGIIVFFVIAPILINLIKG